MLFAGAAVQREGPGNGEGKRYGGARPLRGPRGMHTKGQGRGGRAGPAERLTSPFFRWKRSFGSAGGAWGTTAGCAGAGGGGPG